MNVLEIEQFFSDHMVFQNGMRKEPVAASLGAYGTVICYNELYSAIEELKPQVTAQEWADAASYWEGQGYLAPTFKLLAAIVKRKTNEIFQPVSDETQKEPS